jgi:hypothetical protein
VDAVHEVRVFGADLERFLDRVEVVDRVHGSDDLAETVLGEVERRPHHELRTELVSDGGDDAGVELRVRAEEAFVCEFLLEVIVSRRLLWLRCAAPRAALWECQEVFAGE